PLRPPGIRLGLRRTARLATNRIRRRLTHHPTREAIMITARKSRLALAAGVALAATLALAGCGSSNPLDEPTSSAGGQSGGEAGGDTVVVGSQAYFSNEIVAEIYAQALENDGFTVERKFSVGQRDAY